MFEWLLARIIKYEFKRWAGFQLLSLIPYGKHFWFFKCDPIRANYYNRSDHYLVLIVLLVLFLHYYRYFPTVFDILQFRAIRIQSWFFKFKLENDGKQLLQATRGDRNPNLQFVITHASHVCSQHSFELPLRMYGMHRTQSDHACFDQLSHETYAKHSDRPKRFDLRSLSPALCNVWLLLVILYFSLPTCREKKLSPLGQPFYTLPVFRSTGSSRRVVADWESSFGQAGVGAWAEEIWANLKATFNSQRCVFAIGARECMATNTSHPYTRQIQREKTSGQSTGFV